MQKQLIYVISIITLLIVDYNSFGQSQMSKKDLLSFLTGTWIQQRHHGKHTIIFFDTKNQNVTITRFSGLIEKYPFEIVNDSLKIFDSSKNICGIQVIDKNRMRLPFVAGDLTVRPLYIRKDRR